MSPTRTRAASAAARPPAPAAPASTRRQGPSLRLNERLAMERATRRSRHWSNDWSHPRHCPRDIIIIGDRTFYRSILKLPTSTPAMRTRRKTYKFIE
eukprot:5305877-Prymnesium_polylepis.1